MVGERFELNWRNIPIHSLAVAGQRALSPVYNSNHWLTDLRLL